MVRSLILALSIFCSSLMGLAKAETVSASAEAGVWQFKTAIEHLGQSLYRFGLAAPDQRHMIMLPILRMPVPLNPKPDKITYADFRKILETLVADLDASEASLVKLGDAEFKLPIDLTTVNFDFDKDGKTGAMETLPAIVSSLTQATEQTMPKSMMVHFDTADVYWLRGYNRFISAFAQFMLAHDFEQTFNNTFHIFFPNSGIALGEKLNANKTKAPYAEAEIGDLVAFIHLINWQVVEPARLADVRTRLVAMAKLSPQSWAAARKETDNDFEFLPNAKQTATLTTSTNSDQIIDGWIAVMAEFENVLEGKQHMPHWRFDKGLNVRRFFETSKHFDLVLMITGTDAVNYLEEGPISSSTKWNELMRTFQGNFLGYALWFN